MRSPINRTLTLLRAIAPSAVLITIIILSALCTGLFICGQYSLGVVTAIVLTVCTVWLSLHYRKTTKKVSFLFDSIDNDDFTFSFTEDERKVDTALLNKSLNRIKDIMSHTKQRALEREKYNELIVNSVKTGIITLNRHGHVYQCNNEVLRLFGLRVLTHINQIRNVEPEVAAAITEIRQEEKRQVSFTNERGEVVISIIASEAELNGQKMKIVALNDINNELSEKEIDSWIKLIRVLTHEIMNTLAPVTSLSDTLYAMTEDKNGDTAKGLSTISTMSKNLVSFVESYRKFTHIPSPDRQLFSLKPLLKSVAGLHDGDDDVEIRVRINPEDIVVYADEALTTQVFTNIIRNARQAVYGNRDGRIDIDARIDESENVVVEITDNGDAISPEVVENIFMPFYTTKENGSGIGLSVSRQIMRLHGGSLYLSHNSDGRVTFSVVFV